MAGISNFYSNLFLRFRIKINILETENVLITAQFVNRTESVDGTLRFPFLSHLLYGICVKIFIMNRYI